MDASQPAKKAEPSEKKILIVEDDEAILAMMKSAIEMQGFEVKTARDGRSVVQRATQFGPDLIISDLMMPGVGGFEAMRALQGQDATRKTPVIVVTGFQMDSSTRSMIEQEPNFAAFFQKPLRIERLVAEVHRVLNTRSLQDRHEEKKTFEDPHDRFF